MTLASLKTSVMAWRNLTTFLTMGALGVLMLMPVNRDAQAKEAFSLPVLQKDILSRYDGVQHITGQSLAEKLKQAKEEVVIFDVREVGEYNVSHIANAIQVAPNIWHSPFMRKYAASLKGKTVVFYCSVGVRSSKLARYVQEAVKKAGATSVLNLQYGIFGWHNEKRALINNDKATDVVHPYNKHWGQLVNRNALLSYKPTP